MRPHICWFGEVPFELERIYDALERCTIFMAVGTSGVVGARRQLRRSSQWSGTDDLRGTGGTG